MKAMAGAAVFAVGLALWSIPVVAGQLPSHLPAPSPGVVPGAATGLHADTLSSPYSPVEWAVALPSERGVQDLAAMRTYRPGYPFWQHVFDIPDGSVAFGSAVDGRLLATFPARGDWVREVRWEDPTLPNVIQGRRLPPGLTQRREEVAELLEPVAGPVIHNATRGRFLLPNARRYGGFVEEWGRIYERFGVPAEIGLAQAIIESGLNGRVRSEARALGLCQWLPSNWNSLKRRAAHEIEGYNQTTQAAYCAAYLSFLATKYGSFVPALSEHHAGGTNVGRTVINGSRLGGVSVQDQYFMGSELARGLRDLPTREYRPVVRTYGPRSFLYAEMVFGNRFTVRRIRDEVPQVRIHAMRASRPIPLSEVTRRTGLSVDEVRRFNPALVRQVPTGAALYLPVRVDEFGPDISFWHRPPPPEYAEVLTDFLSLDGDWHRWEDPSFAPVLREFRQRFLATASEEGAVMATVIGYAMDEMYTSRRQEILADFRTSPEIERLVNQGIRELEASARDR